MRFRAVHILWPEGPARVFFSVALVLCASSLYYRLPFLRTHERLYVWLSLVIFAAAEVGFERFYPMGTNRERPDSPSEQREVNAEVNAIENAIKNMYGSDTVSNAGAREHGATVARWETPSKTSEVEVLPLGATIPSFYQPASKYTYGYIGSEDFTMYPLLPPGSFVQVDESKNKVVEGPWRSEFERPIYFVEMRDGYTCCWCSMRRDSIVLQPHPLSPVAARVLRYPQEAEVMGQVVAVAFRLGAFDLWARGAHEYSLPTAEDKISPKGSTPT